MGIAKRISEDQEEKLKMKNFSDFTFDLIRSISYDQQEIINNILKLYNNSQSIDFDPCYNLGMFYKDNKVCAPRFKSDINPLMPGVEKLDVQFLPFEDKFKCIIFDPPFIVSGKTGKMAQRYGAFESVNDLKEFYINSFFSLQRALKKKGLLIVKCQDFVNGRRNYIMLNYVLNLARDFNFKVLDLFILLSKTRPTRIKHQQHARKYHSYFIVLKK